MAFLCKIQIALTGQSSFKLFIACNIIKTLTIFGMDFSEKINRIITTLGSWRTSNRNRIHQEGKLSLCCYFILNLNNPYSEIAFILVIRNGSQFTAGVFAHSKRTFPIFSGKQTIFILFTHLKLQKKLGTFYTTTARDKLVARQKLYSTRWFRVLSSFSELHIYFTYTQL
jgi:hypothetical protein